jgi:hypothetical protein
MNVYYTADVRSVVDRAPGVRTGVTVRMITPSPLYKSLGFSEKSDRC